MYALAADTITAFQLTRPVWGEPSLRGAAAVVDFHFNSLAPCGANPENNGTLDYTNDISTHSPRVGRTLRTLVE